VINLFVNKFEADLCLISIDKFIEITSKRFVIKLFFTRHISYRHKKRGNMNSS